jgi:hypothetical protein
MNHLHFGGVWAGDLQGRIAEKRFWSTEKRDRGGVPGSFDMEVMGQRAIVRS